VGGKIGGKTFTGFKDKSENSLGKVNISHKIFNANPHCINFNKA
jgi:hypothetical protein